MRRIKIIFHSTIAAILLASALAKTTTKKGKTSKAKALSSTNASSDTTPVTPIHPWTLALVAGLALLYGVYEYRADLANRIHQLRRNLRTRRADRT